MQPSKPYGLDFQLDNHSYVKEKKEGIRVSPLIKDGPLVDKTEGASTLYDLFRNTVRRQPNDPFLGWHDSPQAQYHWWTYEQVNEKVEACGSGLMEFPELARKSVKCVGIYAINCPAWKIVEICCWAYGMVVVALYDTLGQEAMIQICNEAELTVAFCDTPERAGKLIESHSAYPELKYIVLISHKGELEHLRTNTGNAIEIILFDDLLALGSASHKPVCPPDADDLAIISYTSGTTGKPKGSMTTSRNILAPIAAQQKLLGKYLTKNDVILSFLPLAHILEQFYEMPTPIHFLFDSDQMYLVYIGARIGFYSGNIANLNDDMRALRPTIFLSVPRMLCRIFDTVSQEAAQSPLKKFFLDCAIKEKCRQVDKQIFKTNSIWDTLVFSKIRSRYGGNIRLVVTGGASVPPPVLRFTRAFFSCPVLNTLGCTECCGGVSYGITGDHVGAPCPCVELKLCDVPEMDLVASRDNKGEICVRGVSCISGYYKNPEASASLYDADGWLHTGDIGDWFNGSLRVFDRCKHIFKLANGEYIAPGKLELVYQRSPLISQIIVDGDSRSNFPVALVVPEAGALNAVLEKSFGSHSTGAYTMEELCLDPRSKELIMKEMHNLADKAGFVGFEKVKNIKLLPESFTVENSLLTPSLKVARPKIRNVYADVLADLHNQSSKA
ncbi:hypothetical protein Aperf_G00000011882 [Anoplocephala perfoliata]